MNVAPHLELLGFKAEDKVTGYKGVVDSIGFDLYGCVQCSLRPPVGEDGELPDGRWFDIARIKKTGTKRVMTPPIFILKPRGPAEKSPRTDRRA